MAGPATAQAKRQLSPSAAETRSDSHKTHPSDFRTRVLSGLLYNCQVFRGRELEVYSVRDGALSVWVGRRNTLGRFSEPKVLHEGIDHLTCQVVTLDKHVCHQKTYENHRDIILNLT